MSFMRYLKFSLRTLLIATLLAGSGMLLHRNWAPWVVERVLPAPPEKPNKNPFSAIVTGQGIVFFFKDDTFLAVDNGEGFAVWDFSKNEWVINRFDGMRFASRTCPTDPPLAILSDGKEAYSVFDFTTQQTIPLPAWPIYPVQSSNGQYLSLHFQHETEGHRGEVWDCIEKKRLWATQNSEWIDFSPDNKWAGEVNYEKNEVRIYDTATGALKHAIVPKGSTPRCVLFPPDNSSFFAIDMGIGTADDCMILSWSLPDGEPQSRWQLLTRLIAPPIFSPDSKRLATDENDGKIRVRDIASGRLLCQFPSINGSNRSAFTFTPDGNRILLAHVYDDPAIFDAYTGAQLYTLPRKSDSSADYALSGQGDRIACLQDDRTVQLWKRIRPEYWWGPAYLPEFWLTAALAALILWSVTKDFRAIKSRTIR